MRRFAGRTHYAIFAILILALGSRLLGTSSRPIWYDEAFSILFAEKGPASMLQGTFTPMSIGAAEEHPLGYYIILWGWTSAFGKSLVAVRALSILAGLGVILFVYLIGRELFSETMGMIAAFLGTLAPFQIHYAQEIRMYSFLCLWLLIATFAFLKGKRTREIKWWVVFATSAALAQYTHNLAALFLVPLAITPLFSRDWRTLKMVVLSGLGAILLYLPWLLQLPAQMAKVAGAYWIAPPGFEKIFTLLMVYVINLPVPAGWLVPALFISLLVFFIGLWQTARSIWNKDLGAGKGLWLLYMTFSPPLLSALISQWQPIYLERTFIASGAMFCLWIAWALSRTALPRIMQVIMASGLLIAALIGIFQHVAYRGFPYGPYQQLQVAFHERISPGDLILHASKATFFPSVYFDDDLPQGYLADPSGSGIDTLADATQQVLGLVEKPSLELATEGRERIWFVVFQRHIDRYKELGQETHPHLAWLDQHLTLQAVEDWGDLRVYLYKR